MKKLLLIFAASISVFMFSSCNDIGKEEQSTEFSGTTDTETIASADESVSYKYDMESLSIEYKEPDIDVPYTYDEFNSYMNLPEHDNTQNADSKTIYLSNGKTVYDKTFDSNERVSLITVYESDETTVKTTFEYTYNSDMTTKIEINYSENGTVIRREQFRYYQNGILKSMYLLEYDKTTGASFIDSYEYNSDGSLKSYLDSDTFNQLISNELLGELAGILSQ